MSLLPHGVNLPYNSSTQCQHALLDIEAIDYFFAKQIMSVHQQYAKVFDEPVNAQIFHVLLGLSYELRQGSLCLSIDQIGGQVCWADEHEVYTSMNETTNLNIKAHSGQIHTGFQFADAKTLYFLLKEFINTLPKGEFLVLQNKKLYSKRYWQYEMDLCKFIAEKVSVNVLKDRRTYVKKHKDRVKLAMQSLFISRIFDENSIQWQQLAAINALYSPLSILTGGAGTGKTYTITRLAILLSFVLSIDVNKIEMIAPTGKAANRMLVSLQKEIDTLLQSKLPKALRNISLKLQSIVPKTINSLLKTHPLTGKPKFSQEFTLPEKVIILDEASMVDISLMDKLIKAIGDDCQLVLVGDPNQLPSVENGSLLADLVAHPASQMNIQRWQDMVDDFEDLAAASRYAHTHIFSKQTDTSYPSDLIVNKGFNLVNRLYHSKRSTASINQLADAILKGDAQMASEAAHQSQGKIEFVDVYTPALTISKTHSTFKSIQAFIDHMVQTEIIANYAALFNADSPEQAFIALNQYALLTPFRQSVFGTILLNQTIERLLAQRYPQVRLNTYYVGKPIVITQNDYRLSLFNGDVGIIWSTEKEKILPQEQELSALNTDSISSRYIACFNTNNGVVAHPIYNLPSHELNYAMTVHKTQGSEFSHVDFLLPDGNQTFLTKQLIYTAVTRAKNSLRLLGKNSTFARAINTKAKRISGIDYALEKVLQQQQ